MSLDTLGLDREIYDVFREAEAMLSKTASQYSLAKTALEVGRFLRERQIELERSGRYDTGFLDIEFERGTRYLTEMIL